MALFGDIVLLGCLILLSLGATVNSEEGKLLYWCMFLQVQNSDKDWRFRFGCSKKVKFLSEEIKNEIFIWFFKFSGENEIWVLAIFFLYFL